MTARWGYPRQPGESAWPGVPYAATRNDRPDPTPLRVALAAFSVWLCCPRRE